MRSERENMRIISPGTLVRVKAKQTQSSLATALIREQRSSLFRVLSNDYEKLLLSNPERKGLDDRENGHMMAWIPWSELASVVPVEERERFASKDVRIVEGRPVRGDRR